MPGALALPVASVVAALALVAAGCGGDEGRSAEDWADEVCSELNTWANGITTAITGVMSQGLGLTRENLRSAANQATASTRRLVEDLREIEPPDTESADRAQEELQGLGESLEGHVDEVRGLVESAESSGAGLAEVGRSVLVEIGAAADETQAALAALQDLGDDLRSGIEDSDACNRLRSQDFGAG